jgi:hypothetical protein
MASSDDPGYFPPSPSRVAQRAMVLLSVACRAGLEKEPESPICIDKYRRLIEWISSIGIRDEFEAAEWTAVCTPLGQLPNRDTINLSWRTEGLAVLAWALYQTELPPYDQEADGPSIGRELGFLETNARKILDNPELRPMTDIEYMADLMLTVHWRLRDFTLDPKSMDFVEFANRCQWAVMPVSDLVLMNNDLVLRGKPLIEAPKDIFYECLSIAQERHTATNWLLGTEPMYSEVTSDT